MFPACLLFLEISDYALKASFKRVWVRKAPLASLYRLIAEEVAGSGFAFSSAFCLLLSPSSASFLIFIKLLRPNLSAEAPPLAPEELKSRETWRLWSTRLWVIPCVIVTRLSCPHSEVYQMKTECLQRIVLGMYEDSDTVIAAVWYKRVHWLNDYTLDFRQIYLMGFLLLERLQFLFKLLGKWICNALE